MVYTILFRSPPLFFDVYMGYLYPSVYLLIFFVNVGFLSFFFCFCFFQHTILRFWILNSIIINVYYFCFFHLKHLPLTPRTTNS
eukprot:UN09277